MSHSMVTDTGYNREATDEQKWLRITFQKPCAYTPGKFRSSFRSPFEQYQYRIGQVFEVLKELTPEEKGLDVDEPMYLIRFADGDVIEAWGEEVCD